MPRNKSRRRKTSRNDLSQKPRKKARKKSRKKKEEARRIMANQEREQHRQEGLKKPSPTDHKAGDAGEKSSKIKRMKPSAGAQLAAKKIRQEADLNHCSPADKIRAAFVEKEIPRPTDFSEYKPKPEVPRFVY
jgi:hypothetical protein